jgi:AbrB family looped-hinge helix DNA binding protein
MEGEAYASVRSLEFRIHETNDNAMTTIVKVQQKGQVTIPTHLRSKAGIAVGDRMEATFQRGKIVLTPKLVVDRSRFPNADGEYTPEQRRTIDARLAEASKGPFHGPFDTADEAVKFLRKEIRARKSKQKTP